MIKIANRIRFGICLFYSLFLSFAPYSTFSFVSAQNNNINAQSLDTIAGYSTIIQSSIGKSNTEVTFKIEKPDGGIIKLFGVTNPEGKINIEFLGYHTKHAGLYKIYTYYSNESPSDISPSFTVYPDTVSLSNSSLTSSETSLSAGTDNHSFVIVRLRDKYNNPISDHQVTLISSRPNDKIVNLSTVSDKNGELNFKISSIKAGISTFIATDLNTNTTLNDRLEIVFYKETSSTLPIGGNELLLAELLAEDGNNSLITANSSTTNNIASNTFGTVDHFKINIEDQAEINQEINVSIIAQDINNNIVKDYTGDISFAVNTDENATLPSDYKFTESDQGQKIFSLGIKFTMLGKHVFQVFDKSNWEIIGEKEVEVIPEKAPIDPTTQTLQITSPSNGLKTSQTLIFLSGVGKPNTNIFVFMDDQKIGEVDVSSNGDFTFTAKNLTEGLHNFYVLENTSGTGEKSNVINVELDITYPILETFEINPEGLIKVKSSYHVKLISEAGLDEASIVVNGIKEVLLENNFNPGTYEGTFIAPDKEGSYPIQTILIDSLQNKSELDPHHILQVFKEEIVPIVTGLVADTTGLNNQVKLTWSKVDNYSKKINNYKIYFGKDINNLNKSITTTNNNPNFIIKDLESNTKYYFAITAIDEEGIESLSQSSITTATTKVVIIPLKAISSDSQVTLNWNSFPNINAQKYRIYYGTKSRKYTDFIETESNNTSYVVSHLQNGTSYYFIVAPINQSGEVEKIFTSEAQGAPVLSFELPDNKNKIPILPTAPVLKPVAPPLPPVVHQYPPQSDSGPEVLWVIISSFLFVGIVYRIKNKVIVS